MKTLLFVFLIFPMSTWAQYKCVVDGHTTYSENPCGPKSTVVVLPADTVVTDDERKRAAESQRRQKQVAQQLGLQRAVDDAVLKQHAAVLGEEARQKKARCANLLATAKSAQTDANLYRTPSFQDDARRRQKEAEDAHFFECYNRHF